MDPAGDAAAVWQGFNGVNGIIQGSARAAGGSFDAPVDVSAGGATANSPQVALDPVGDAVAVWSRSGVAQAATRPAGGSFGAPVGLSAASTSVSDAHVAVDTAGDAIAVWRIFDGTNFIVQAAVRPAGGAFGAAVNLTADGHDAFAPDVAMDPAGDAVVVWFRYNGTSQVIQAAARPAGGSFSSPVDVSQNAPAGSFFPHVAMDQAGDAVAVWYRSNGSNNIVQASVAPAASGVWQTPADLSATGEDALNAAVATDPAGDAVAVWQRSNGTNQIVQAAVRPAGGSFGASVDLSATGQNALSPQVAMDQAGDAVVAWQRSNGTNVIIQAVTRPATGSFSSPHDLSATGEDAESADVAMDQAGDAIVTWSRSNGTNQIVQAAGYDFAGPELRNLSIPASGVAGVPVSFSVSPVDVWSGVASTTWGVGDGQGANGTAVSHTYATAGTYQVTVTSVDGNGNITTTKRSIMIVPVIPLTPPTLSALRVFPRRFVLAGRRVKGRCVQATRKNAANKHCRRPIKLSVSYALNGAATVTFTLKRLEPGRKIKGRCVKPSATNRKQPKCTRLVDVSGKIGRTSIAGANRFTFNGKIAGHTIDPGTYQLTATPAAGGQTGKPQSITFKILT